MDCDKQIYWDDFWPLKGYRCPKCYAKHRRDRRNDLARRRYAIDNDRYDVVRAGARDIIALKIPTCEQCGEKFRAKRSDAKYCSPRYRVAAKRAKSAKTKTTKKRRVRAK
jgi:hypothetical protein